MTPHSLTPLFYEISDHYNLEIFQTVNQTAEMNDSKVYTLQIKSVLGE